ncbi:MAG: hypothetical protein ACT4OU_03320 [Hyphomicrobium sp.]
MRAATIGRQGQACLAAPLYFVAAFVVLTSGVGFYGTALAASLSIKGELNYDAIATSPAGRIVRVHFSPGGSGASAMALGRVHRLVIDGSCNSACAWAFIQNPKACFTSKASFGFHAAHDPGTGRRMPEATKYWLAKVRPSLRQRLSRLRNTSSLIRVSAAEMRKFYGDQVCETSATSRKSSR